MAAHLLGAELVSMKVYHFVEYTPVNYFNNFVQSAIIARSPGGEKSNFSLFAETMKLLANNAYGYQFMDRSRHSVARTMNNEKSHAAINNKMSKSLEHFNDRLDEVEFAESESEFKKPIIVGFLSLQ